MRRKDRYDTADLDENQFEPSSRHRVMGCPSSWCNGTGLV